MTIYDFIYTFITGYILPAELPAIETWGETLATVCVVIALMIFWACFLRPFWWLIKYGIFGNSAKARGTHDKFD